MSKPLAYSTACLFGLALPAAAIGSLFSDAVGWLDSTAAVILCYLPALFFALVNFHLSFTDPMCWRYRHGHLNDYQHVSGLPVVGTLAAGLALFLTFGDTLGAILAFLTCLVDTGGLTWFMIMVVRHKLLD